MTGGTGRPRTSGELWREAADQRVADALTAVAELAAAPPYVPSLLDAIAARTRQLVGADACVVEFVEGAELVWRAAAGPLRRHLGRRLPRAGTLSDVALASGHAEICADAYTDPRTDHALCKELRIRSVVAVPLLNDSKPFAVVKVTAPYPEAFDEHEARLLALLGRVVGTRLEYALICERQRTAEDRLNATRIEYAAVLDALDEGVVVQDAHGTILLANRTAERILGVSAQNLAGGAGGEPPWELVQEDGTPWPAEKHPALVALRTGTPQRQVVMGVRRLDGVLRWTSVTAIPLKDPRHGGAVAGVVVSLSDITEQRAAEEALAFSQELVAEAHRLAGVALWEWDPRSGNLFWSEEVYDMLGIAPGEVRPTFRAYVDRVHPDDHDRLLELLDAALRAGGPFTTDHRIIRPDGRVRRVHSWGQVAHDSAGRPVLAWGALQDVTDRPPGGEPKS